MRFQITTAVAAALAFTACSGGQGQSNVKAPDSVAGLTKAQVEAIVKEYLMREPVILAEAFGELQRREDQQHIAATEANWAKLASVKANDPTLGPADAPITIVEFTDYNCGFCKAATPWVMNQVDDRKGDIRVIIKESAVRGPNSELAAAAALAAQRQGKYREMHVALMKVPANAYTSENIEKIAKSVGLDLARFNQDMQSREVKDHVAATTNMFGQVGLQGTPSFFINGKYVTGFDEQGLNSLIKATREQLKS